MRSRAWILLALVFAAGRVSFAEDLRAPVCEDCNVIFISMDTLRADYGTLIHSEYPLMPTLDGLAARGIRFTNAISASSWTLPASMSWFTGVIPSSHGVTNKYPPFSDMRPEDPVLTLRSEAPELVTLAEVLKGAGFRTAGFTGGAALSSDFGFSLGFEVYEQTPEGFGGFSETVPQALRWIDAHRQERLFVFLHGYDCHGQYDPPGGLDYRFVRPGYSGSFTGTAAEQRQLRQEGLKRRQLFLTEADKDFWRAIYAEKAARADAALSAFMDAYARLGIERDAVIIVTSDHGEELMEHDRLDHGPTLYEEVVRVPLILTAPGLSGPVQTDRQARAIDLFPTILYLAGIEPSGPAAAQMQGQNLFGAEFRQGDALMETEYRYYITLRAIRQSGASPKKLILQTAANWAEYYELQTDPGEKHNLRVERHAEAERLQAKLGRQMRRLNKKSQR